MNAKSAVKSAVQFVVQVGSVQSSLWDTVYEVKPITEYELKNAFAVYMNPRQVGAPDGMGMKKRLLAIGPDGRETELAASFVELF
jgi:hypothetical protein